MHTLRGTRNVATNRKDTGPNINFWDQRDRIWPPRAPPTFTPVRIANSFGQDGGRFVNGRSYIRVQNNVQSFLPFLNQPARVYRGHWTKRASNLLILFNTLLPSPGWSSEEKFIGYVSLREKFERRRDYNQLQGFGEIALEIF